MFSHNNEMRKLVVLAVRWPSAQAHDTITFLFVTLPHIFTDLKKIHSQTQQ